MATNPKIHLFDTTVFVDFLRGVKNTQAALWIQAVIDGRIQGAISIVTVAELWAGVKDKKDEKRHKLLLARFRRFPLHTAIAYRAGQLAYPFHKARDKSISLPDFIIAATAEYYETELVTRNTKDFSRVNLNNVQVNYYK